VKFWGQPEWEWGGTIPSAWATGNEIHGCILDNDSSSYGPDASSGALLIGEQTGMRVYDNTITQTARALGENGFGIKAVTGLNKALKIYSNQITVSEWIADPHRYAFAIELWNTLEETEIYYNRIVGTIDIVNTDKMAGEYAVDIHDNEIGYEELQDQYEVGILFEQTTTDVKVRNNLIENLTRGIQVHAFNGTIEFNNIYIYNNVLMNLGCTTSDDVEGIYFVKYEALAVSGVGTYIWNNTIVADPDHASKDGIVLPPNTGAYSDCEVRNNIIKNWGEASIKGNGGDGFSNLSIQHNIMYGNGNSDDPLWADGFDPEPYVSEPNMHVDPMLESSTDYHLKQGSPAEHAGMDVGLVKDRDGNDYDLVNGPAAGAYEYTY
jgi:hypothetical protein